MLAEVDRFLRRTAGRPKRVWDVMPGLASQSMSEQKMHADEIEVPESLVRTLVDRQFPSGRRCGCGR